MNDIDTLLKWAKLIDVLLIPIAYFVMKMRDDIRDVVAGLTAHKDLDEQKFNEHRRELDRHEHDIGEAHRRLDEHGAPAASAFARTRQT